jgi:cephalosporin-C deacetylase-like acetyl esterase
MRTLVLFLAVVGAAPAAAPNRELEALQRHFEQTIQARFDNLFTGINTVKDWEERKKKTRMALEKMLWGERRWPAEPPPARITRREEQRDYVIENIVLETAPDLYATANLYLPRSGRAPFPVILYQCGHANKDRFMRHGAWFAAHGIAVMVIDNIEMGEIEFTHHGVYSHAWFHWYSRGFSPLAVELLNARRAVDYLASRADLDRNRIGATGRSGGGMTTFFLAALDERIKASAPVSGVISTRGWVKHRLTFAHCDCQYPVNSHGLLYEEIGALAAPRLQLMVNADADRGFPMDAFNELAGKMGEVYRLYRAEGALRTAVAAGGHSDTEAIRLPVYSFFLKEFLGIETPVSAEGAVDEPPAETLVCFRNGPPLHERLTRIDEELLANGGARAPTLGELGRRLREDVFRYFPSDEAPLEATWSEPATVQGRTIRKVTFNSFEGLRVRAVYSLPLLLPSTPLPAVVIVDHRKGIPVWGNEQPLERSQWGDRAVLLVETLDRGSRALEQNLRSFSDDDALHHMKRQAMIAGVTLEAMQVYEVLQSLRLLRSLKDVDPARITITGRGESGINGLYAALLDGKAARVVLGSPPSSHQQGPHYLGILRHADIPDVAALMGDRIRLYGEVPAILRRSAGSLCSSLPECLR